MSTAASGGWPDGCAVSPDANVEVQINNPNLFVSQYNKAIQNSHKQKHNHLNLR